MGQPNLIGEKVSLRPLVAEDINGPYLDWLNDPEVTYYLEVGRAKSTRETSSRYLEHFKNSQSDFIYAICDKETGKHIGTVTLNHIHPIHKTADSGIMIGDKDYWGKGFAYEAWGLLLNYAFTELKLNKIIAGAAKENVASLRLQEKLGFKIEGELRQEFFCDGKYLDAVRTGLLATEFQFQ